MAWYIYRYERQSEVMELACEHLRLCAEGKREGNEVLAQTIKDWILNEKWGVGMSLHVRDGVATLEWTP